MPLLLRLLPTLGAGWLAGVALLAACDGRMEPALRTDAGGSVDAGASAPEARWHVARGMLVDREGRSVVLRGANVSSAHKAPPWFDFHGPDDWRRMRERWGMNAVRFLVEWAAIEPTEGQHDPAYLDAVRAHVHAAGEAGLLVVLDMHQDVYGPGFSTGNGAPRWTCDEARYAAFEPRPTWFLNYTEPNVVACYDGFWASERLQARYVEAWRALAGALGDEPAVIGFDPMNEPYWGSLGITELEPDHLWPLYERVRGAVSPRWMPFLEPAASSNLGFQTHLPVSTGIDAVYAPHSYDADAEGGAPFDAAHRADVLARVADLRAEADARGWALVLGEYGGSTSAGIDAYMRAEWDGAQAARAGMLYWHYGKDGGYGLLDAAGAEKAALLDVVARPYPARVAGVPTWTLDDAGTLVVTYEADPAVTAPDEIALPDRGWSGATVSCDCAVERRPGVAVITHRAGGTRRIQVDRAAVGSGATRR